jgi:hypothetical protein
VAVVVVAVVVVVVVVAEGEEVVVVAVVEVSSSAPGPPCSAFPLPLFRCVGHPLGSCGRGPLVVVLVAPFVGLSVDVADVSVPLLGSPADGPALGRPWYAFAAPWIENAFVSALLV